MYGARLAFDPLEIILDANSECLKHQSADEPEAMKENLNIEGLESHLRFYPMAGMTWTRWGQALEGLSKFDKDFAPVEYWFEVRNGARGKPLGMGFLKPM